MRPLAEDVERAGDVREPVLSARYGGAFRPLRCRGGERSTALSRGVCVPRFAGHAANHEHSRVTVFRYKRCHRCVRENYLGCIDPRSVEGSLEFSGLRRLRLTTSVGHEPVRYVVLVQALEGVGSGGKGCAAAEEDSVNVEEDAEAAAGHVAMRVPCRSGIPPASRRLCGSFLAPSSPCGI